MVKTAVLVLRADVCRVLYVDGSLAYHCRVKLDLCVYEEGGL